MLRFDLFGCIVATLTAVSRVLQTKKASHTKTVSNISLGINSAFTVGLSEWQAYNPPPLAWPIVTSNAITVSLVTSILVMKLRYRTP